MNDGFGAMPSLLDGLVFYPVWIGSQCIDIISGAELTNSANAVSPTILAPSGEPYGYFSSTQYLTFPKATVLAGDIDFTLAAWLKCDSLTGDNPRIIGMWNTANSDRGYLLYYNSTSLRFGWMVSSNGAYSLASDLVDSRFGLPKTGIWNMLMGRHDANNNLLRLDINNFSNILSYSQGVVVNSHANTLLTIGKSYTGYINGAIGPTPIWKRLLSDREQQAYYANGQGINISQFFLG